MKFVLVLWKSESLVPGAHIPNREHKNNQFLDNQFFDANGESIPNNNEEIIEKFSSITGIKERKYTDPSLNTSDLAAQAAKIAIDDAQIDPESLDYIILAQNVGDITAHSDQSDALPSVASRGKS